MKRRTSLIAVLAVALFCSMVNRASAQQNLWTGGGASNPNGPTVSPYLNLLQNNDPNLTNYQSLVRPLISQSTALRRQGGAIQQLQSQRYASPTGGATGIHSFFGYYSHYYSFPGRR